MTMTHDGRTQTVMEWSEELGVKYYTLRKRLKSGFTPEEAVAGKRKKSVRPHKQLTINGVTKSEIEWAEGAGITAAKLRNRINQLGWTPEEALRGKR
jgi:hypothetical protein